jgi:hypothetical protein
MGNLKKSIHAKIVFPASIAVMTAVRYASDDSTAGAIFRITAKDKRNFTAFKKYVPKYRGWYKWLYKKRSFKGTFFDNLYIGWQRETNIDLAERLEKLG